MPKKTPSKRASSLPLILQPNKLLIECPATIQTVAIDFRSYMLMFLI